jgi:hypothetical protein
MILVLSAAAFYASSCSKKKKAEPAKKVEVQQTYQVYPEAFKPFQNNDFKTVVSQLYGDSSMLGEPLNVIDLPAGLKVDYSVNNKSYSGTIHKTATVVQLGKKVKTLNGYLENYVLSNYKSWIAAGYILNKFPDSLLVKDHLYFFKNYEFDGHTKWNYQFSNFEDFDQNGDLNMWIYPGKYKPFILARNVKTGAEIPLRWDGTPDGKLSAQGTREETELGRHEHYIQPEYLYLLSEK